MLDERTLKAERYFIQSTSKVYVEVRSKIEPFEDYLNHRYKNNSFYYSTYACMGLKADDRLVRGSLDVQYQKHCYHGWVEFQFEGHEYVFDPMITDIVPKQEWYQCYRPKVDFVKTQKEILDEYLNDKCALQLRKGFWQFKFVVYNLEPRKKITYGELKEYDKVNGYVPFALTLSRISVDKNTSEVLRFIAYADPFK